MAHIAVTKIASLVVLLVILVAFSDATDRLDQNHKLKETNIVFYMHDWQNGLNVTNIAVGGNQKKQWSTLEFGTMFVIDDKLTVTSDRNSTKIGRAQGIYVNTAVLGGNETALHLLFSIVFTNKEFNGSTLEIQGADKIFQPKRGVSVVSGTGEFRLARGYATIETASIDVPNSNAILKLSVTVFHH